MIYTVTFNPSIDYIVSMNEFSLGKTNRTTDEKMYPGGKGINVSTVLTNFGIANIALGFIAGFTGDEIHRLSRDHGILCDFIKLPSGNNRINIKLKDSSSILTSKFATFLAIQLISESTREAFATTRYL